jgi:peptide/nickel transport system substrate-binding protein
MRDGDQGAQALSRRTFLSRSAVVTGGLALGVGAAGLGRRAHAQATRRPGGTLTIVGGIDVDSMDPHINTFSDGAAFRGLVYDSLVSLNERSELEQGLAKSQTVSSDGLMYTFTLEQNVKFHDGLPFDARAVKLCFDRVSDPNRKTAAGRQLSVIAKTDVVDPYTVRVTLKKPYQPFLRNIAYGGGDIASNKTFEEWEKNPRGAPIGTGPYKFESWRRDDRLSLVRNPQYFKGAPAPERVVWRVAPEESVRVTMLKTGEADVVLRVPPHEVASLRGDPKLDVLKTDTLRSVYLYLNQAHPPFDNRLVRQAVNYAIDRQGIVDGVLQGAGAPSYSILGPAVFGYHPVRKYTYDPRKAREMLETAKFDFTRTVRMFGPEGRYVRDKQVMQAIQAQLGAIGVKADVQLFGDFGIYTSTLAQVDKWDMGMYGWSPPDGDADFGMYLVLHGQYKGAGCCNFSQFQHREVDALLDQGRSEPDAAKRVAIYRKVQEIVIEEAAVLFSHVQSVFTGVNKRVRGFAILPSELFVLDNAWIAG